MTAESEVQAARDMVGDLVDRIHEELKWLTPTEADLSMSKATKPLRDELEAVKSLIKNIDAHAKPYGPTPDRDGVGGSYLVDAGALHRAIGTLAPEERDISCQAEYERNQAWTRLRRLESVIMAARDWRKAIHNISKPNYIAETNRAVNALATAIDSLNAEDGVAL